MELFYGGGGRSNPDFRYKVKINRYKCGPGSVSDMMEWCDNYPVTGTGYFQRYYVNWRSDDGGFDDDHVTFQFEWEEPAILFTLKFAS